MTTFTPSSGLETSETAARYRVLIVEDNLLFRHYLADSLLAAPEVTVIGAVGRVAHAVAFAEQAPDLVLLDLGLPDGGGLEVIAAIREKAPACKFLVITVFEDRASVLKTLRAGADGYVLKDATSEHLVSYVRSALAGVNPISSRAARHLLKISDEGEAQPVTSSHPPLRPREKEMLEHIAQGLSQKAVARLMNLSPHTVAEYTQNIYRKLSVKSRGAAVFEAIQHKLIDLPERPAS
ncbi:response regulator [Asticcacaulis biprosthecium C19]|uniref:Response regulator n=1 Tax=Asticcacaulis biprosthecium C19 TaxID=715226 RepID=F4QNV5_9CAUL|nr:response regulator transcription factor [Asticcacaulis biprosthecium]EGF91013.1 response regulator [Asticcacaulis biprosthecium C19]